MTQTGRSLTKIRGFESPELDYQLLRTLGTIPTGGAALAEFLHGVSEVVEGDPDSWSQATRVLGERLAKSAKDADEAGDPRAARDQYLRANQALRNGEFWSRPMSQMARIGRQASACFTRAMELGTELGDWTASQGTITFNGEELPYTVTTPPPGVLRRPSVVVLLNGSDGTGEEAWFWAGRQAVARGHTAVVVDVPGQTGALRTNPGSVFQPQIEEPLGAILDGIRALPQASEGRLTLFGFSFGGYAVTRGAARLPGIDAVIASPPLLDLELTLGNLITADGTLTFNRDYAVAELGEVPGMSPIFRRTVEIHCRKFGVGSLLALLEVLPRYRVSDDELRAIAIPSLAMVGAGEGEAFFAQADRFARTISGPATLHRFDAESGADAHCQIGNVAELADTAYGWLESVLDV